MKIGIDLGGSHIAVGLIESNGNILSKIEVDILKEDEKNIKDIIENYIFTSVAEMNKIARKNGYDDNLEIGIAIPGTVNNTTVIKSVNLGLENYNIVETLEKKLHLPIKIKNDAKCAALAENCYGSLKQYSDTLFFTLGTGIGGAAFLNNKLLCPEHVAGFEFGHMIIKANGKMCKCGKRGCFEQYGSMKAFKQNVIETFELDKNINGEDLYKVIKKKFNNNDSELLNIIDEYTTDLSIGISNLINVFEPQAIGIGGSFTYYDDILMPNLKSKILSDNLLFNKRDDITINSATLGNDAGIIGATLI